MSGPWILLGDGPGVETRDVDDAGAICAACHATAATVPALVHGARYEDDRATVAGRCDLPVPPFEALPRGALVGRARVADVFLVAVDTPDPWAIPLKGSLGFFEVPDALLVGARFEAVRP